MKQFFLLVLMIALAIGVMSVFQQGWISSTIMIAIISFVIGYMYSQRPQAEEY